MCERAKQTKTGRGPAREGKQARYQSTAQRGTHCAASGQLGTCGCRAVPGPEANGGLRYMPPPPPEKNGLAAAPPDAGKVGKVNREESAVCCGAMPVPSSESNSK